MPNTLFELRVKYNNRNCPAHLTAVSGNVTIYLFSKSVLSRETVESGDKGVMIPSLVEEVGDTVFLFSFDVK